MTARKGRGFAGMDEAKQRAIASRGGKAAHQKGTAHRFSAEEARAAGRKGGQAAHVRGTAHEFTAEEARAAGRKGGQAARARGKTPPPTTLNMNLAARSNELYDAPQQTYEQGAIGNKELPNNREQLVGL